MASTRHSPSGLLLSTGLQFLQLRQGIPQGVQVAHHHRGLAPSLLLELLLSQLDGFNF